MQAIIQIIETDPFLAKRGVSISWYFGIFIILFEAAKSRSIKTFYDFIICDLSNGRRY